MSFTSDTIRTADALRGSSVQGSDAGGTAFQSYYRCPSEFGEIETTGISFPFDLSSVVTDLRQERYCRVTHASAATGAAWAALRASYYLLRPILPVPVRKHLQQLRFHGWQNISFPKWPVDFTVDTLMQDAMAMKLKCLPGQRIPFIWFWPDGAPACGILTHDVEAISGRNFCGELMDLDDAAGLKASFQVVPEGRYPDSHALCASIRSRGFEVNVHDLNHDGHLFDNQQLFLERARQLNEYARQFQARGFRSGAMYRNQEWFGALEFSYDMSVPNVAHLEPQRGGCCTVMPYFVGNLVELPLTTIQDYSLFHILGDYSIELWKTQIDLLLAGNGLVTLLTHPDYLIETRAQTVYKELLGHVRHLRDEGRLWVALPRDVDTWWRNRDRMTLVQRAGSWRIEGTDSDRARVAYATLVNDQVVYELNPTVSS